TASPARVRAYLLRERRRERERPFEPRQVLVARDLDRTERREVGRQPLHVEQPLVLVARGAQQLDERDERGLRRVAHAGEHRLAGEAAAARHTVDSAGELAVAPDLDAVRESEPVQADVGVADLVRDPVSLGAVRAVLARWLESGVRG